MSINIRPKGNPIDHVNDEVVNLLVDCESTGTSFIEDKVIELCFLASDGYEVYDSFRSFVKIDKEELKKAQKTIGHIVNIDIDLIYKVGEEVSIVCENMIFFINKYINKDLVLVAHNLTFDYSMILKMLGDANNTKGQLLFEKLFGPSKDRNDKKIRRLDTIDMAMYYRPGLESYSLNNLIKHFNLCPALFKKREEEGHSGELDCYILAELFHFLNGKTPFKGILL